MSEKVKSFVQEFVSIFRVGEIVQVSNKEIQIKYMTHYVGSDSVKSLMTTLPVSRQIKQSFGSYKELFRDGDNLVMRMVVEGTVYAFQSEVLGLYTKGSNILISTIPEKMQTRGLRIETRYPCIMRCTIVDESRSWEGAVVNISMSGCQLKVTVDSTVKELVNICQLDTIIKINISFPFAEADNPLDAQVKSVSMLNDGSMVLGCYFQSSNATVKRYFELSQLDLVP